MDPSQQHKSAVEDHNYRMWLQEPGTKQLIQQLKFQHLEIVKQAEESSRSHVRDGRTLDLIKTADTLSQLIYAVETNAWAAFKP